MVSWNKSGESPLIVFRVRLPNPVQIAQGKGGAMEVEDVVLLAQFRFLADGHDVGGAGFDKAVKPLPWVEKQTLLEPTMNAIILEISGI